VDPNVLIDFFIDDPKWSDWSLERLHEAAVRGPLLINEVIYAETSTRYYTIDDFEAALMSAGVTTVSLPRMALFRAGKAFLRYRRAGGFVRVCCRISS
jgi:predicted nucleic acid-binding protein